MPLTYSPFADTEPVEKLAKDLRMNMSDSERIVSGVVGAALISAAVAKRGLTRWTLLFMGTALLRRGWTGQCSCYAKMEIDRRHDASGVPGNRGTKVEHRIEIHRSPEVLFAWWRDLENIPHVMRHVLSVQQLSNRRSHWEVRAPFGQVIDWYAEIIHEVPGELIAWQSLPGAALRSAGTVRFEPNGMGGTHLRVVFEYDPPAGALGAALASTLTHSPQHELAEDLARFKEFAERELDPFATGAA